ncbi:MAG TPA: methyltransferase domain-containing protein [Acidimicrobiales bacterium]
MSERDETGEVRRSWDAVAQAWEEHRARVFDGFRHVSEWLVEQVDPQPGETVVDLAAGPGETGFLAAERVGESGRVLSTDIAPGMVEAARRGAATRHLDNVECRVLDAQAMDLPDQTADAVICRLGFMLMPDPGAALREVRRILKPGGKLAYAVIGAPDRNAWMGLIMMSFVSRGHMPSGGSPFGPGGPFSLADPARNVELARAAGFSSVDVQELTGAFDYADVDDHWSLQLALAGPVADMAAAVDAGELAEVKKALANAMEPHKTGDHYELSSHLLGVVAS